MPEPPPDPNAETQIHIPEFKRESSPSLPWLGIGVIAILMLIGLGLIGFALFYGQGEAEERAITGTVGAVLAFTQTPAPTLAASSTPVPTLTPVPLTETAAPPPTNTDTPPLPPANTDTPAPSSTNTRAATQAPAPTSTPLPPSPTHTAPPAASAHGITGTLTLCNPEKPTFATHIERVCFRELIVNNSSETVTYGVLGVLATNLSGGPNQFQTSWRGDLSIAPGATGPTGGGWEDGMYLAAPGTYRLTLSICYSSVDACLGANGDWETLTAGVNVTAVDWTPSP
jgi:hypothetical protein